MIQINKSVTELLRETKRDLIRFRQGSRPNILIFGIRRGGSTLLAEMLAHDRGMWFANEPFAVFKTHHQYAEKRKWLPELLHSQFFDLNSDQSEKVFHFTQKLLAANLPLGTCRRTKPILRADRVLLKILNAPFLIDWFCERFVVQSLFLTRHPAAQALSVIRNNWGFSVEAYLERPEYLQQFMSESQVKFGRQILASGSMWEKAILNWVFENYFPLYCARGGAQILTYEELVTDLQRVIGFLGHHLNISDRKGMYKIASHPSGSSRMSTRQTRDLIKSESRMQLISRWKNEIDDRQVEQAQRILDIYEIDIYSMKEVMPTAPYLLPHG